MKKNEEKTNVIRILEQNKINFKVYNYINSTAISGTEVADYLGEDYNIVFKKNQRGFLIFVDLFRRIKKRRAFARRL